MALIPRGAEVDRQVLQRVLEGGQVGVDLRVDWLPSGLDDPSTAEESSLQAFLRALLQVLVVDRRGLLLPRQEYAWAYSPTPATRMSVAPLGASAASAECSELTRRGAPGSWSCRDQGGERAPRR